MAKTGQDDTFYQNNFRTLKYLVVDEDVAGEPAFDLSGYTVKWSLSRLNSDGTWEELPELVKDFASGVSVPVPATGWTHVIVEPEDTEYLLGQYYAELEIFDGAGRGLIVATGTITLLRNVKNP